MKVLSCKIKRSNIIYTVETNRGNIFEKSLPKKITSYQANKRLKKVENKIDTK